MYIVIQNAIDATPQNYWDLRQGKTIIIIANRNKEPNNNNQEAGHAGLGGTYTIIYNSGASDYTTYTHELGHILGLEHPFENKNKDIHGNTVPTIQQGTSQNYMDYAPLTNMFWKWQWDLIRTLQKNN